MPRCLIATSILLSALLLSCGQRGSPTPRINPSAALASQESTQAMAPFAPMVGSNWAMTSESGYTMFDRWSWGPGKRSVRVMTDGQSAAGTPWRHVQVYYWDPALRHISLRGFSCYANGLSSGTITFDGTRADGRFDLIQDGGRHRTMAMQWEFDGPDSYHDTLLESTNSARMEVLTSWTRRRVASSPPPDATPVIDPLPQSLSPFSPLLDHSWETAHSPNASKHPAYRTILEWVPLARVLHVRVESREGEPGLLLDAYLREETATGPVRCLALTADGGVYEGTLTSLSSRALTVELSGTDLSGTRALQADVTLADDDTVHTQIWSITAGSRSVVLDIEQKRRRLPLE